MHEQLYGAHVREMQGRWEAAMLAENCQAIFVHAGTPIISFLDDYSYAFRPNPNFLAWLPLTHHPESVLLIRPGEKPALWFYQPEDYWHLPPSDPEEWWGEHIDVRVVADAESWRSETGSLVAGAVALGDAPVLQTVFPTGQVNPPRIVPGCTWNEVEKHITRYPVSPSRIRKLRGHMLQQKKHFVGVRVNLIFTWITWMPVSKMMRNCLMAVSLRLTTTVPYCITRKWNVKNQKNTCRF